jgi:hypothetical protein
MKRSFFIPTFGVLFIILSGSMEATPMAALSPVISPVITPGPTNSAPAASAAHCKWAGVRASTYGIDGFKANFNAKFPLPQVWDTAMTHMASHWTGATKTAIWLVGMVDSETGGTILQFTKPGALGAYDRLIKFNPQGVDHEACLTYFDSHGITVFLQLEPGNADVEKQIDAALLKFKHHRCVAGLAIDVEWYKRSATIDPAPYLDADQDPNGISIAEKWERAVKKHSPDFRLLLKHWSPKYLTQNYKGQIIFCCDGQGEDSEQKFLNEHKRMAEFAYPNPIIYQIGYPSDKAWWGQYPDPPQTLGDDLIRQTRNGQDCGVLWVDFSFDQLPPLAD